MPSTAASKTITELKVSAHLMILDAGLFCVFNSPGAPPPDAVTGLPGVRLSPAPAPAGSGGTVDIRGFNEGGWLGGGNGAALVRVMGGAAPVLVTIYQDPAGQQDAPKLQVIRLTEAGADGPVAAPARPADPAPDRAEPTVQDRDIEVAAHIYGRGDVAGRLGSWMGERGSKRWIEGFGLMPGAGVAASDIEYQAVLGRNWQSPWSEGGQFCGSRGMSLPILGLRIRLRGAAAKTHKLSVSASFVDGTEVGPVPDGEVCEAPSLSPLEAFQVTLQPLKQAKSGPAPDSPEQPAAAPKRGRAAASAAPAESLRQEAPEAPKSKKSTAKPDRKTAPAVPDMPAIPPKAAAKRTPATIRRR
jgi:hypothetical protein